MKKTFSTMFVALMMVFFTFSSAHAIAFYSVTNNDAGNVAIGEAQLAVSASFDQYTAAFVFSNVGPAACSITDVYFDFGPYQSVFAGATDIIIGLDGVKFSEGATPHDLPGGGNWFTAHYSADSDNPVSQNGVNPWELLAIQFISDQIDWTSNLQNALDSGDIKIGIHVQAFANGGSESFVTTPATQVPEPASLLLLGLGLLGIAGIRRKK